MEKPDSLFHFSEDPTIEVFKPRVARTQQVDGEYVWAVTGSRIASYWFPRQCPRATWWSLAGESKRVHAIEWTWFERFCRCELYVYRFDPTSFTPVAGDEWCWTSTTTIVPIDVEPVGPLLDKHRDAGIELRLVDDLMALWANVITRPGVEFSGIRLTNAAASKIQH